MEEILYVKIAQNIPVAKRQVTFHDLATLHCTNKKVVQELNQMVFYTLPAHGPQKTMFTIAKVYEVIHQKYPNLKIENLVGSCSNLGDAQARRLGIRVRSKENPKELYFAHTLNNTVVAPPRMLIAFLENNLREDGSVAIPKPLQPYMGGMTELRKK